MTVDMLTRVAVWTRQVVASSLRAILSDLDRSSGD